MAFWNNFGKKKEQVSETDQVFKKFGHETNEVKAPEKMTRNENIRAAEAARNSEIKKEQLMENLNSLRKNMSYDPLFDDSLRKLETAIDRLKRMDDNENIQAMSAVDNFILAAIKDAKNYVNRRSKVAMRTCITNISNLINDRMRCGDYYTDVTFLKYKNESNALYVDMQNQQAERDELEHELEELHDDYVNTNSGATKASIVREVTSIKEKIKDIDGRISELNSRIMLVDKNLDQIRKRISNHARDHIVNVLEDSDEMLAMKRENEHDAESVDKIYERMGVSNQRVSSSALNVNDNSFEQDIPETLGDDFFKV